MPSLPSRVLVTGGSGFIGTHLMESLRVAGCAVLNLSDQPPLRAADSAEWQQCDVTLAGPLAASLLAFAPDAIVHLAARTSVDPWLSSKFFASNVLGLRVLLDALAQSGMRVRLVCASTMLVCRVGHVPTSDTDYCPNTRYGASKQAAELMLRTRDPAHVWTIIRPTGVWGPWDGSRANSFLPTLAAGRYLHPGWERCLKTFAYVENVCDQIQAILAADEQRVRGRTFYLGDPPIDLRVWVDAFARGLGVSPPRTAPRALLYGLAALGDLLRAGGWRNVPLTRFRYRNMVTPTPLDVRPIHELAGPSRVGLEEGVARTVEWWRARAAAGGRR